MGQIVSSAAKPKRCNLNKLSQFGIPAAGEHILVSSDNSMNAAGQGNFDCYIVGDGSTAATALPLIKTYANDVDDEPTAGSKNLVESGGVDVVVNGNIFVNRSITLNSGATGGSCLIEALQESVKAKLLITGVSGKVVFFKGNWVNQKEVSFEDGVVFYTIIPKDTNNIYVALTSAVATATTVKVLVRIEGLNPKVDYLLDRDAEIASSIDNIQSDISSLETKTTPLEDYDKETVYKDYTNKISAGNYRLTSISISPLQQQEYGYVLLKGLSGKVFFCDFPSWATLGSVDVVDNQIAPCIIPAGADLINVHTVGNIPVEVDTPFHLEIRYGTISNLLDEHESKLNAQQEEITNRATTEEVGIITPIVLKDGNSSIAAGNDSVYINHTALTADTYAKFIVKGISGTLKVYTEAYGAEKGSYAFTDGVAFQGFIPKNTTSFRVMLSSAASEKTDFSIRVIYNDVSGRLSGVESVWTIVNETQADYYRITCFDIQDKIAAGQYRCIKNTAMTALDTAVYGDLEYSGDTNPVIVSFLNPSYVVGAEYEVSGTAKMRVLIPDGCRHIIVRTKDGQTVESDQTFSVKASYLTTDMRAAVETEARKEKLDNYNENNKFLPILQNLKRTKINSSTGTPDTSYKELVLQVITDIHDQTTAAKSFLDFNSKYASYIDDMIGAGDYQNGGLNETLHLTSLDGWHDIIKAIGNHDVYTDWPSTTKATEQVCYDTFMADHIDSWGVEYQEGKTYFYKDYNDAKVRVVFLDYMHWDEQNDADGQKAWLQNILYGTNNSNSALSKQYHVIIVRHCVPQSASSGAFVPFENCPFVSLDLSAAADFQSTECDIVNTFMQNGGIFVAWLCGHAHLNWAGRYENYTNQLVIVQPCSANFTYWRESAFTADTDYVNQFNLYGIDSTQKRIKVYRVGAVYDRNMQHTESLTLSYDTTIENKVLHCF